MISSLLKKSSVCLLMLSILISIHFYVACCISSIFIVPRNGTPLKYNMVLNKHFNWLLFIYIVRAKGQIIWPRSKVKFLNT